MKLVKQNIGVLVLAGALVVTAVLGWVESAAWREVYQTQAKQQAIQGCMEVGTIEYMGEEGSPNAKQPNWEVFEKCMDEKGL